MTMSTSYPPKRERRWYQFRLRTILLGTAVFALLLGCVVHFWPYLWWRFGPPSREFSDLRRVPTGPMPITETPDHWVRCRLRSLEFSVPSTLANAIRTLRTAPETLRLDDATRTIFVYPPESTAMLADLFQVQMIGSSEEEPYSLARLRLATFEASWDDFRWTMSRRELHRHMYLVSLAGLTRLKTTQEVETFFADGREGLLYISGRLAGLEWYSADGRTWGRISFVQRSGDMDLSWIRAVCQSLNFHDEPLTERNDE